MPVLTTCLVHRCLPTLIQICALALSDSCPDAHMPLRTHVHDRVQRTRHRHCSYNRSSILHGECTGGAHPGAHLADAHVCMLHGSLPICTYSWPIDAHARARLSTMHTQKCCCHSRRGLQTASSGVTNLGSLAASGCDHRHLFDYLLHPYLVLGGNKVLFEGCPF